MEYDKKLRIYRVFLFVLSFSFLTFFIYNFYSLYVEWNRFYETVITDETGKVKSMVESTLNSGGDPVDAMSSYRETSRFLKGVKVTLYEREFFIDKVLPEKPYEVKTIKVEPLEMELFFDTSFKREFNSHLVFQFSFVIAVGIVFILLIFYVLNLYFKQLLNYEKERHEKERLKSISVAISSVLHEVKNSLSRLNMLVYALLKGKKERENYLNLLKEEIQKLSLSIDDVSSITKSVQVERGKISVKRLVESVLKEFNETVVNDGIEIVVNVNDTVFLGDFNKLKEVLRNLVKNGIEALREANVDKKVLIIEGKKKRDGIVLRVKDSGGLLKNISSDEIFKPFKTTKDKGFGMGLYSSLLIVKAHGGNITAYVSREGYSVFEVILPY